VTCRKDAAVIEAAVVRTEPLPNDVREAVIEALARMLEADFRARTAEMVGTRSGADRSGPEHIRRRGGGLCGRREVDCAGNACSWDQGDEPSS